MNPQISWSYRYCSSTKLWSICLKGVKDIKNAVYIQPLMKLKVVVLSLKKCVVVVLSLKSNSFMLQLAIVSY